MLQIYDHRLSVWPQPRIHAIRRLSSQEKFPVNSVPKAFIKDRISSSSAAPFMATKRRQKYLACFQTISMRLSSGL